MAGKTLEEHFREQAELIDERFAVRDSPWEARFRVIERDISGIKNKVSNLETDVGILKADVSALRKDMVIVREGVSILLKRGRLRSATVIRS